MAKSLTLDVLCGASSVLVGLFAAGCAVTGPAYQRQAVQQNKAAIYVYRTYPTAAFGWAAREMISCGDYSVTLGPGGYHRFLVEPGDILCSTTTENTADVQVHAEAGHEYYLRQWFSVGVLLAHVYLEQVEPEAAQRDIQTCKQQ